MDEKDLKVIIDVPGIKTKYSCLLSPESSKPLLSILAAIAVLLPIVASKRVVTLINGHVTSIPQSIIHGGISIWHCCCSMLFVRTMDSAMLFAWRQQRMYYYYGGNKL